MAKLLSEKIALVYPEFNSAAYISAVAEITKRNTGEYAIRPFIPNTQMHDPYHEMRDQIYLLDIKKLEAEL